MNEEQCVACGAFGNFQSGACPACEADRAAELGINYEYED